MRVRETAAIAKKGRVFEGAVHGRERRRAMQGGLGMAKSWWRGSFEQLSAPNPPVL